MYNNKITIAYCTLKHENADYWTLLIIMYKTAVYTLVNGAITHQKPQI